VQVRLKRKHDRSSHEAVRSRPLIFNPALRFLIHCRLASGKKRSDRPRQTNVECLLKFFHSSWPLLRRLFSEDCANCPQSECWCGATLCGEARAAAKRAVLFQFCTTAFFGSFEKQS
jgi:hypothetical protein